MSTLFDGVLQAFSGNCGALVSLDCVDQHVENSTETLSLSGLIVGQQYYFRVYPYSSGQTGNVSACITGPCNAPTNPSVNSITPASASFSFSAYGSPNNYTVTTSPATVTQTVTTSPVNLSGLLPGTYYEVTVVANCNGNTTSAAVTTSFTTSAINPAPDANGILYVKKDGIGNGGSWSDALGELAYALKGAKTNTAIKEIWVAAGTYHPLYKPDDLSSTNSIDRANAFLLVKNVKIYGGFSATAADGDGMQIRNWKTNPTILSGDFSGDDQYAANGQPIGNNGENAYRVVTSFDNVGTAELNGFTVKGANGIGAPQVKIGLNTLIANCGGGIANRSSSPAFSNIIVTGNTATVGGGIYNAVSSPVFKNILINGNTSSSHGAGAYNANGNPTFINVTISNNNSGGNGAIMNASANPTLINTIVSGNNAGITGTANISYSLVQGIAADPAKYILDGNKNVQFTDPANGDYTLKTSSPAINAGNPQTNVSGSGIDVGIIDLAGNVRIQKGTIDLGAYESAYDDSSPQPDANGIFYVNKGAGGAGTSWNDALGELDEALKAAKTLNAATPGTVKQIWVAKGTYQPALNSAFSLLNNVSVYGGFSGTESSLSARNWKTNVTTLKGNGSSVFVNENLDDTPLLDGFRVTEGTGYNLIGGGIYNSSASPVISNCIITGNSGTQGGGIANIASAPTIINCLIYNNSASDSGGGIHNSDSSTPMIINSTISKNDRGGIADDDNNSYCKIYNTIIWGNVGAGPIDYYRVSSATISSIIRYSLIGGYAADAIHHNLDGNVNPQFTDIANGNLTLKDGSLAVNAGDPKTNSNGYFLQTGNADLANNARIQKRQIDMGAFESPYNPVIQPDANGIFYVKKGSPGNGTSWDNAMGEVADALKLAKTLNTTTPGTVKQIWVAAGTYHPIYDPRNLVSSGPADRFSTFVLVPDVKLFGGFTATATDGEGLENRDWKTNRTVLSGDYDEDDIFSVNGQPSGNNSENAYHVVVAADAVGTAELNGFIITGANGNLNASITANLKGLPLDAGGGLYAISSAPIITNTTITGNYANSGGGVYNSSASPNLNNVVISGNSAGNGGGIVNYNSTSPIFNNVIVANNTASFGGGMLNQGSSPVLNNMVIYGNTAATYGNGIRNIADSYLLISNSIIYGNSDTGISNGQNVGTDINYSLIEGISANAIKHNLDGSINPKFTDAANNDFTLQASSPAINAGDPKTNTAGYPVQVGGTDIAGNTRIFDGQIDLGAFEHQTKHQVITFSNLVNDTIATVYGDADFSPASSSYSDAIITYSVPANNDAVSIVDGKIHLKNAGDVVITVNATGDSEYDPVSVTKVLRVAPRKLTVTADAQSKIYGDADPVALTYEISFGTLVGADEFTGSLTRDTGENVGTYAIKLGDLALNDNYELTYQGENLEILPATITGVTLSDQTFTYDGTVKSLEVTGLPADASITYTGNDQKESGTYTVTATVTLTNYADLELTAELKINKAASVITADATQTFTYNGTAKSVSGTLNHSETTLSYDPQQSYTNAGSYSITLKSAETANYLESSKTVTLKINPATITGVTLADQTFTYDGTTKSLEVTDLPADASITYTGNDQTDAGTYTVTATVTQTNYEDLELTAELKISKATSVITADATQTFTYNGTAKSVTGTLNHSETTISYDPQQSYTHAGSYSITLKAAETANYLEASKTVTLKINPATITGVTLADRTFTYDGTAKSLEVTGLPADASVTYTSNDQTDAGTYTVTAIVTQANYADLELTAELKINKAASVITADATQTFTYDGTAKSVSGTLNHSETTISYDPQQSYTNAGSYSITLKAAETANYLESSKTATLKINPATITGVTLADQTFTYDGTAKSLEVTGLPADASVTYTGNDQKESGTYTVTATVTLTNYEDLELTAELKINKATSVITADATQTFTYDGTAKSVSGTLNHSETTISYDPQQSYTNAGSYSITLKAAETVNYLEASKTVTLKINRATITGITLADQTFTYDGTAKSLEVTGLPADATVAYTGNDQTAAGTYTVTATVTQDNYADLELTAELKISKAASVITADATQTFTYDGTAKSVSGTLNHSETTISYDPQQSYTDAGSYSITLKATETTNYLESTKTVTLKINLATITGVTLTGQTFTYDGTAKSIEIAGLPADATVAYTGNDQTDAGTYTVTATVTQDNYADLELTAELKISKAASVITANATQTFTYNGTAKSVSGTLNHSETTISYDPQQSYTNAGSYSITLNAAETANYLEATKTVTLKINPATITSVTLADQTFTYDGTAKSLEVTGLPSDASVTYTGNDQTDAGTYTVTAIVTQANYADLELTAELKISKAASVITADATQTFTYNGTAKSVSGTLNHSETTLSYAPQQSYTNAGSYSITLKAAETTNYLEATKTVTLKINPATITGVTLADQTFTYDGTTKSIEVTGLPAGAIVNYTGNGQTDAGTYTVTATVTQANYADLELTAELKINKAVSVITADATQTFTYDGTAKSVTGTLNHSETTLSYDPQQSYTNAGSYSITLKAAETANYLESSKTVTLKINPATITGVTLADQTFTYDGTAKSLEVTGLPAGAIVNYTGNGQTDAGNYTITATVTQTNYADLELTAELKISKAASVITADAMQTFMYDGTAKSVSGTLNHSETTISYDPQQSYTNAGSYSITLNAAETENYQQATKTVTLKINPAMITGVTLADQTFTYDGTAKSLEVAGLPVDATVAYTGNDQTDAGTYTITATVTQDNYADLELTAELKISKAASVITANAT
ncbi:MBG domain-containing protein, partial [Pedobacter metabolipauper]|uniref:MBG domain-containing protein n=1 Tax=Pedobacter metabolipauper TaxID=425513 RepID=UPI001AAD0F06